MGIGGGSNYIPLLSCFIRLTTVLRWPRKVIERHGSAAEVLYSCMNNSCLVYGFLTTSRSWGVIGNFRHFLYDLTPKKTKLELALLLACWIGCYIFWGHTIIGNIGFGISIIISCSKSTSGQRVRGA